MTKRKEQSTTLKCHFLEKQECLSCNPDIFHHQSAENFYIQELSQPLEALKLTATLPPIDFSPSPLATRFRNKAKMVVGGTISNPTLGLISSVDLSSCPLYPVEMEPLFFEIKKFITLAKIPPYILDERRGELKYVIVMISFSTKEVMIRFVLRSQEAMGRIKKELSHYAPFHDKVISINIQPEHSAIIDGLEEFILTPKSDITEILNKIPFKIYPKAFFQTNPLVAAQLYKTATKWIKEISSINTFWDLYCGVGGFSFHLLMENPSMSGLAIEIDPMAKKAADSTKMILEQQLQKSLNLNFITADIFKTDSIEEFKNREELIDLMIVNPPRRGLGPLINNFIKEKSPSYLLYSSCHKESLASDLIELTPYFSILKIKIFEMFPHTKHFETLVLLQKS